MAELERCPHCGARIEIYARSCHACGLSVAEEKIALLRRQRLVSDDVFDALVRLLRGPEPVSETDATPRVRKQVARLGPADLDEYPIWQFALDEEGEDGQDEETVRPRPDLADADPGERLLVVRTEFVAADGTRFDGYVVPSDDPELSVQPTIVTARGQAAFWLGAFEPRPGQIEAAYDAVGKMPDELFPLRFRTLVPVRGEPLEGKLPAFLRRRSPGDERIVELK